ncbi:DUF3618 domain-containing protein [Blastococcus sp. TF02-8]|uniref:DUF3618 domain-containing protein n=1 Tax=Blastococcus sp. TF02-8 TaxID=2250574 RepID=UPI000DE88E60|nr:DUF3618 domain-containing protein [Blastococcus sp. TF02-8]RBY95539.1 DUF3618 domain-containing protein [Blastococcus sp. TF02-8]
MSTPANGADGPTDVDAIKADIDATREQLGRTVDELTHRLDVPARTKESALRARDTAVETYRESPPLTIAGLLAVAGLVTGIVVLRKRRAARATRRRKR